MAEGLLEALLHSKDLDPRGLRDGAGWLRVDPATSDWRSSARRVVPAGVDSLAADRVSDVLTGGLLTDRRGSSLIESMSELGNSSRVS